MDKIEFVGWVGKLEKLEDLLYKKFYGLDECIYLDDLKVFTKKGTKDLWTDDQWPPKKVKITMEIIK